MKGSRDKISAGVVVPVYNNAATLASVVESCAALGLPVIVVVNSKRGALNPTLLAVAAVRAGGLPCAGLILNQVADERDSASISNRILLEQLLPDVPVLAEVMHGEDVIEEGVVEALR